jgi:hypothetical protein
MFQMQASYILARVLGAIFLCEITEAQEIVEPDLAVSKDYGISRAMITQLPDDRKFSTLRENDFAKMSVDDSALQSVYLRLFTLAQGSDSAEWQLDPHIQAAFNDLKKRGDSATPMLLKLAGDNPDTHFEAALLFKIDQVTGMDMQPYVEYARGILDTRFSTMTPGLAGAAASFVLKKGNASDLERLHKVLEKRPYLAHTIKTAISRHEYRASQSHSQSKVDQSVEAPLPQGKAEEKKSTKGSREAIAPAVATPSWLRSRWPLIAVVLFGGVVYFIVARTRRTK